MFHIAIVEDCQEDSLQLKRYLSRYEQEKGTKFKVSCVDNGMDFIDEYDPDYDIVLMDIEMPYLDGMSAAKKMREIDQSVCLIFVTNMAQYAIDGYEVDAMDFLVKPITFQHFALKLEKALWNCSVRKERYYGVQTQNGVIKVPLTQIYYVESEKHYLKFHTWSGIYRSRGSIKELAAEFPGETFVRCHASYLVNLDYVTRVAQDNVQVKDVKLPVSRACKKEFTDAFTRYLGGLH